MSDESIMGCNKVCPGPINLLGICLERWKGTLFLKISVTKSN